MEHRQFILGALTALWLAPLSLAGDSDGDGFVDNADNCTLVSNPDQRDSDSDGFGNICDADFNNDFEINAVDLGIMRQNFFSDHPHTDLNGDGVTNTSDLGLLKIAFFGLPGPTGDHPVIGECNCYFSSDCEQGEFCEWGSLGFAVEEDCWWRVPKPLGVPGTECNVEYEGGPGPICDGHCVPQAEGSSVGVESAATLVSAAGLWADALITPSARGGGPVDEQYAQAALSLPYARPESAMEMGRHVADLLSIASDFGFYDYFCHYEAYPDDPAEFVDLTGDGCRVNAARLAIDALQAEIAVTGSGAQHVADIARFCTQAEWENLFAPRCKPGAEALSCFEGVVAGMAEFLTTPRAPGVASGDDFLETLRSKR